MMPRSCAFALAMLLAGCFCTPIFGATFSGLGIPDGTSWNIASDVSSDGRVVVGSGTNGAFRWTAQQGVTWLGSSQEGFPMIAATGVSGDGTVVVGRLQMRSTSVLACKWTQSGGAVAVSDERYWSTHAEDVSADGSVIVGFDVGYVVARHPFMWQDQTATDLGVLPGGASSTLAKAVSADGKTIVGYSHYSQNNAFDTFIWKQETGMAPLGHLPSGNSSGAVGISADGSVVVGWANIGPGIDRVVRWTAEGAIENLGYLGNASNTIGMDVSADGSVIVGRSGGEAFCWNATDGMRSLKSILMNDYGLDLTGWTLSEAAAVSADGKTIVGTGFNPAGVKDAWIASIPEPCTMLLLLGGAACLLRRRR